MATLSANRLREAANLTNSYAVEVPAGHTLDDALDKAYWAHYGERLRPHDTIRLIPEEGDYFAEAVVVASGRGFAQLKLLRHEPFYSGDAAPAADPVADDQLLVKWVSPANKYGVIRKSDGHRLKEGFSTKMDAQRWANDYLGAQAR